MGVLKDIQNPYKSHRWYGSAMDVVWIYGLD